MAEKAKQVKRKENQINKEEAVPVQPTIKDTLVKYCTETDTDILMFNGAIGDSVGITNGFVDFILGRPHRKNCMLFLTTYGGDANWV